ncbi:hypothetical protein INT44_001752 [Umbelopsis vinacea]|uniref:PH domain-containing protein n=1 Tax=Umbelopsis vinacea TaxID=44442 RepID=A0A8H7UGQ2_9FUNG|nr:hypothetical protein INT44_001752 [Umbelopsis vinacea]KAI9284186.1 hypothetical protein BC943DRAFT_361528 [Umbelopsis sp. AD052]
MITTHAPLHQPKAGWLSKIRPYSFGNLGWSCRFFVLLGSELRYYKNEYADTPSRVISLRSIKSVSYCPTSNNPYAFRLEPMDSAPTSPMTRSANKTLVLRADSEYDMQSWVEAIRSRLPHLQGEGEQTYYLNAMKCCFQLVTPPLSPTTGPPKRPHLGAKVSSASAVSITSESSMASDISSIHESDVKMPLCARRGVFLAPIRVHRPNTVNTDWIPIEEDIRSAEDNCDSPTFALYKERFGL